MTKQIEKPPVLNEKQTEKLLTVIVREMIASYNRWPIMAHGDKTYAPRVAKWLSGKLAEIGYIPIGGHELLIQQAKREIFEEVEAKMYNASPKMIMPADWLSLKSRIMSKEGK